MTHDDHALDKAIDVWEKKASGLVADAQVELTQRRSRLELDIEANPLPFQPSPVLMQLIRSTRQPRSSKNAKQSMRAVEYLERKLEAEIRQHYELENAQHCAARKQLHLQSIETRRVLVDRIERDYSALCLKLQISPSALPASQSTTCAALAFEKPLDCDREEQETNEWLQTHLQQNWVAQERFNVQEAFTNQTRKLQADLDEYLEQLDADCEVERQHVLTDTPTPSMPMLGASRKRQQLGSEATSAAVKGRDVSVKNRKLDELQRRLQSLKEDAEVERKERMAQIGRQCAHLFTRLDCLETEAKLAHLLAAQEMEEMKALDHRVADLAHRARGSHAVY